MRQPAARLVAVTRVGIVAAQHHVLTRDLVLCVEIGVATDAYQPVERRRRCIDLAAKLTDRGQNGIENGCIDPHGRRGAAAFYRQSGLHRAAAERTPPVVNGPDVDSAQAARLLSVDAAPRAARAARAPGQGSSRS